MALWGCRTTAALQRIVDNAAAAMRQPYKPIDYGIKRI